MRSPLRSSPRASLVAALLATSCALASSEARAQSLAVGQPAPELSIATWVHGAPFKLADMRGKIVVVEFWATWCPPCRTSIPHLDALQARLADKGVVIVGVSDEDLETVKPFHAAQAAMRYHVAVDADRATSAAYMEAAGVGGIPHAFVVGKDGALAWHGHPMDGLDRVLDEMVAGTFDVAKRAALAKLEQDFQDAVDALASEEDLPTLLAPLEALMAADPTNRRHYEFTAEVLARTGRGGEIPAVWVRCGEGAGDDAAALIEVAGRLSTPVDLLHRDLEAAKRFAAKAVALAKDGEAGPRAAAHAALARAEYALGRLEQAIHHQELAVGAAPDDESAKKILAYYRAAKAHGAKGE